MRAVPVLMLLMSGAMKLVKPPFVVEGFKHLGFPESLTFGIGMLELACMVVYLIPRTAISAGAILTHLRVGEPVFIQSISGCSFGADFTCVIPASGR